MDADGGAVHVSRTCGGQGAAPTGPLGSPTVRTSTCRRSDCTNRADPGNPGRQGRRARPAAVLRGRRPIWSGTATHPRRIGTMRRGSRNDGPNRSHCTTRPSHPVVRPGTPTRPATGSPGSLPSKLRSHTRRSECTPHPPRTRTCWVRCTSFPVRAWWWDTAPCNRHPRCAPTARQAQGRRRTKDPPASRSSRPPPRRPWRRRAYLRSRGRRGPAGVPRRFASPMKGTIRRFAMWGEPGIPGSGCIRGALRAGFSPGCPRSFPPRQ